MVSLQFEILTELGECVSLEIGMLVGGGGLGGWRTGQCGWDCLFSDAGSLGLDGKLEFMHLEDKHAGWV